MSLARSGSRALTVDGDAYRWAVSPDSGYDVVVVQSASGVGAKLLVTIAYSRVAYRKAEADGRLAVTPGLVTSLVRQARADGWEPGAHGRDMVFDLQDNEAIAQRGAS